MIPPYLTPAEVSRACGMGSARKAKRMLIRAGIAERLGGHWSVSESRLRERLPDVYERVYAMFAMGDGNDQKRPQTTRNDQAP